MKKIIEKVKVFFKKNILGMIIGAALVGGITLVNADYRFTATKVYYDKNTTLSTKTNVGAALDELYTRSSYGNADKSQILTGRTAYVGGNQVTGTMANNGSVGANLSWGGSKIVPAGYTSGGTITCPAWSCASGYYCPPTSAGVAFTNATITPGTSNQTITLSTGTYITSGGTKTIAGDGDLSSGNIVRGVNIFGVVGSASVFKSAEFINTAGTIKTYKCSNANLSSCTDITTSGYTVSDDYGGGVIGKFTNGTWRRMSYQGESYKYYSIVSIPLPTGVSVTNEYVVQVSLGTDYYSTSSNTDDYGFRLTSDNRYTHGIHCSGTNSSTEWGYNSIDGGQWVDSSNSAAKDNAVNTTCGVSNNTIYIKLETKVFDNTRSGACWWTRGSTFKMSGRIFYN